MTSISHFLGSRRANFWAGCLLVLVQLGATGCVMYQPTAATVPGMSYVDARNMALQIGRANYLTDIQVRDKLIHFLFQSPGGAAKPSSCKPEDIDPSITDTMGPPYILYFGERCDPQMVFWDFDQAKRLADALYMIKEGALHNAAAQAERVSPSLFGQQGISPDR